MRTHLHGDLLHYTPPAVPVALDFFTYTAADGAGNQSLGTVIVLTRLPAPSATLLLSANTSGAPGDGNSGRPAVSADGRRVAFHSWATDLDPTDGNGSRDVFVHNGLIPGLTRVSASIDGLSVGDYTSWVDEGPAISANGRYVAFATQAKIVPEDSNGTTDVFVHDLDTSRAERVSLVDDGSQAPGHAYSPAISTDGEFIAFISDTGLTKDAAVYDGIYVRDRLHGRTELVSVDARGLAPNRGSCSPAISADGRFVAFVSGASNGARHVYVRDRWTDTTECVSVALGIQLADSHSGSPSMSADGRFVAFESMATNLVEGDSNGTTDIFVRDRLLGLTERVSVSGSGEDGDHFSASTSPCISSDGDVVAFRTESKILSARADLNIKPTVVYDRRSGTTRDFTTTLPSGELACDPGIHIPDIARPSLDATGGTIALVVGASSAKQWYEICEQLQVYLGPTGF